MLGASERRHPHCDRLLADVLTLADDPAVDGIVVGAQWFGYFAQLPGDEYRYRVDGVPLDADEGRRQALTRLEELLRRIARPGRRVSLLSNIPVSPVLDPRAVARSKLFSIGGAESGGRIGRSAFVAQNDFAYRGLAAAAAAAGAEWIDPLPHLCDARYCYGMGTDGRAIYKDGAHLRPTFVRSQVRFLDRYIDG